MFKFWLMKAYRDSSATKPRCCNGCSSFALSCWNRPSLICFIFKKNTIDAYSKIFIGYCNPLSFQACQHEDAPEQTFLCWCIGKPPHVIDEKIRKPPTSGCRWEEMEKEDHDFIFVRRVGNAWKLTIPDQIKCWLALDILSLSPVPKINY